MFDERANSPPSADEPSDRPLAIGRYPILRRIGAGGMGIVYAAYDEVLDRRLAIKVLHVWDIDGRRRERLLREAQALARVDHPNVITVHDVGTTDDQLFVAMEFVAGCTLEDWLAVERRSWPEIVAVFRQVADGLAAIHAAGLVHRDVKPTNVMIGEDRRVRVLDLGLATTGSEESTSEGVTAPAWSSSSFRRECSLTRTGERVGTPAYMSREQFLGLEPTPASDIFSLSVALYEALFGAHPFMAGSYEQLQRNVVEGRIAAPTSSASVPAWLHALVVRGLAPDPEQRPASMRELSAALGHDPGRARRRWLGIFALALVAALAGVLVTQAQRSSPQPTCDGGETAIASAWNRERAHAMRAAMSASDQPYAGALAGRVSAALDDYADDWAAAHRRVCLEHARGDHSDALLDARMACLAERRSALGETVALLVEADAEIVENSGQLVAKLPRLAACDDLAALAERAPLDPRGAALESRLVKAEALAGAGRIDQATAIARAVAAEAEAEGRAELLVHALLGEARMTLGLELERSSMAALLDRALQVAIAEGLDALAAEAMIRRLYVRGLSKGGSEAALADLPLAEAMVSAAGDEPELRALLLNNAGAIQLAAGNREAARIAFERSLAIKERLLGEEHLELALTLANLGMLSTDAATRRALHERMIEIYARRLGPDHPRTLDARWLAAVHTADPEQAGAAFEELCPRFVALGQLPFAGECELEQGRLELGRARLDRASEAFRAARTHLDGDERRVLLDAYLELGLLELGEAPSASVIAALRELIATTDGQAPAAGWWLRQAQAERRLLLAQLLVDAGAPRDAVVQLEQALVDLEAIAEQAQPIAHERLLADVRFTLAHALVAGESTDHSRIAALVDQARAFYSQWPRAYAPRLERLASSRASPPKPHP